MAYQWDNGGDQVAVQTAECTLTVGVRYDERDALLGCSLADHWDVLTGQCGYGAGWTHGVGGEAGANAGACSQTTST